MSKTQALTPELKELQKKYKDDPKKAQGRTDENYTKYGLILQLDV